jgi:hypothetical protein
LRDTASLLWLAFFVTAILRTEVGSVFLLYLFTFLQSRRPSVRFLPSLTHIFCVFLCSASHSNARLRALPLLLHVQSLSMTGRFCLLIYDLVSSRYPPMFLNLAMFLCLHHLNQQLNPPTVFKKAIGAQSPLHPDTGRPRVLLQLPKYAMSRLNCRPTG